MANFEKPPQPSAPGIDSSQTVLGIIPPTHWHPKINNIRALYVRQILGQWPPHIKPNHDGWKPLMVAGIHLWSGLSESGVAARKSQLQALLIHFSKKYTINSWIIEVDFNITTDWATIEDAEERRAILAERAETL